MQRTLNRWWKCRSGERWIAIDLRARAVSGLVVMVATAGAWLCGLAEGRDGTPYGQLLAIGGVAYIAAIAFLRRRSQPA